MVRPLGWAQDGLGIVLVRFSCRLVVRDRFLGRLGLLLGSFWGALGVVLGLLGADLRFCRVVLALWMLVCRAMIDDRYDRFKHGPSDCALRADRQAGLQIAEGPWVDE